MTMVKIGVRINDSFEVRGWFLMRIWFRIRPKFIRRAHNLMRAQFGL